MKKILTIICISLLSCNTAKQLERTVAKVERYKKALGIKPCDCRIMDDERIEWLPKYPIDPHIWGGVIDTALWYMPILDSLSKSSIKYDSITGILFKGSVATQKILL